jgi:hypothetical protein
MHVMMAGEHRKKSLPDANGAVKLEGIARTIEPRLKRPVPAAQWQALVLY